MHHDFDEVQLSDRDWICSRHLSDDPYLERLVAGWIGNGHESDSCALCDEPGWEIDSILPEIASGVTKFYERAADSSMIFEEGEFEGQTFSTEEVLDDLGIDRHHPLRGASLDYLEDTAWVASEHEWPSEYRLLTDAWQAFGDHVKYRGRFLFDQLETKSFFGTRQRIGTTDFLHDLLDAVANQPVRELDSSTILYCARSFVEGDSPAQSVSEYASPPRDFASQGRMNPAGIAFFYGALDADTAAAEVYAPDSYAAVMQFKPIRVIRLIDLTSVESPSPFDDATDAAEHHRRLFTHEFVDDISRPIVRDDRIHRDYVPTQAVTEYIRYRTSPRVDGIMFRSARAEGTNVVVFVGQEGCLEGPEAVLRGEPRIQIFEYEAPSVTARWTREF